MPVNQVRNHETDLFHGSLLNAGSSRIGEDEVDFPFRVSPSELTIIENDLDPPCSTVLVGRSGTGKTTCAVYKMWFRWLAFRHHSTEPFHQVHVDSCCELQP